MDDLMNMNEIEKLGLYFPLSIQTAYFSGTDSNNMIWFNSSISKDLEKLKAAINNYNSGAKKSIKTIQGLDELDNTLAIDCKFRSNGTLIPKLAV